ncbi:MAG TPA: hypothetical protein VM580_15825, partial [Labilithrix sp.]|nr:hypothetical protein [Labilithrix sp.]
TARGGSKITFFTAGTIGAGHLARGITIERALARASSCAELTIVGPPSPFTVAEHSSYRAIGMDPAELFDRRRAPESLLAKTLYELAPDVLVVDMFWAPLLRILPRLKAEAWLLVRKVPPDWFVGPPGHSFDRMQFARIVGIEPGLDGVDETIDPLVLVRPEELRPRGSLRAALDLAPSDPLVVVHHAGGPGEYDRLLDRATKPAHVFTLPRRGEVSTASNFETTHHDGARFFPFAEWLADADEIVTGAGYNTYWETRSLRLDAKVVHVPFPRPLDDQAWRVASQRAFLPRDNGADVLVRMLQV